MPSRKVRSTRVTYSEEEYRFDKVLAALVYLARQPERVTLFDKKKALSLLFLADKTHLLRYGSLIFGDYYRALQYGAVPQRTLDRLNKLSEGPRGSDTKSAAGSALANRPHKTK